MTFKKELWNKDFSTWPRWPCPTCGDGRLALDEATLVNVETAASVAAQGHDAWDVDWIDKRFSAHMNCSECGERVTVIGKATLSFEPVYDEYGEERLDTVEYFSPKGIFPAPMVVSLPKDAPKAVKKQIARASELLWVDVGACANRLRAAAEDLLTEQKVQRVASRKGKRHYLPLASRIEKFSSARPEEAQLLHSIRFLGNVGAHGSSRRSIRWLCDLPARYREAL